MVGSSIGKRNVLFLIWGSRGAVDVLGFVETRFCEICERDRDFYITRRYRYGRVFWIPLFSWDTELIFHCDICSRGYVLTEAQAKPYLDA